METEGYELLQELLSLLSKSGNYYVDRECDDVTVLVGSMFDDFLDKNKKRIVEDYHEYDIDSTELVLDEEGLRIDAVVTSNIHIDIASVSDIKELLRLAKRKIGSK